MIPAALSRKAIGRKKKTFPLRELPGGGGKKGSKRNMKKLKRMLALLAAFALVLAMAVPAWAENATTGSITIQGTEVGETYSIYKIFDVVSYDTSVSPSKIVYKVTSKWKSFFADGEVGATYITLDKNDQVSKTTLNANNAAEFAAKAIAWAQNASHGISVTDSKKAEANSVTFDNVANGYYLVDTSLGALCSLDNVTGESVTIKEKNDVPQVEKRVKDGADYKESNSAKIGDKVDYQTTITITGNVTNVILHDKMENGLTFDKDSVKVQVNGIDVAADNYTLKKAGTESENPCTFEIEFKDEYIAGLAKNTKIVVTYSATLNEKAVIGMTGNKNDTWLKYGNSGSVDSETTTYSYSFDIVKTDSTGALLAGAKFRLYSDAECENEVALVVDSGANTYRVAKTGETGVVIETNADSALTIKGLKNGTYYLKEIEAPKGYNMLENAAEVTINSANISSNLSKTESKWVDGTSTGIHVINNAGTTLPSTGGMGTTIFYVVGGGLMAVAVVLLVTKKRMENKR